MPCSILEGEDFPKSLQNAKYDRLVLQVAQGIQLQGMVFDLCWPANVLESRSEPQLADLSLRFTSNLTAQSYNDLVSKGKSIAEVPVPEAAGYCGAACTTPNPPPTTCYGWHKLQAGTGPNSPSLQSLFEDIELPREKSAGRNEGRVTGYRVDGDLSGHLLEAGVRRT